MAESRTITVDEQLLAGRLREQKEAAKREEAIEEPATGEQPENLRQAVMTAKREEERKSKSKEKVEDKVTVMKTGSKQLLKWAWRISASVIGFLPGILYINTHAFLRIIFPNFFCELGEEWYPEQLKKMMDKAGVKSLAAIKVGEKMLLVFIDILLAIAIIILISLIKLVYDHTLLRWALELII